VGITQQLSDFVAKTDFEDLPEPVVKRTKQVIMDSIGCALGSYRVPISRIVTEFVLESGASPQATVIGNGKTSWALAAFANGDLISALDYDALGPIAGHIVAYTLPSCLAMAEKTRATGRDLITACAVGLEAAGRVASSMAMTKIVKPDPPYYESNPRQSFSSSVFGGAAGAGKLLKLNGEEIANAFGIVGASAPVPATRKAEETSRSHMTHYNAWPGWTSQLAATAALLAKKGYTGDDTILDGDWGFWQIYGSPFFKPENLVGGLGKEWHVQDMTFKRYPCCGVNHTSIQAICKIMRENRLRPEDVQSISIAGDPMMSTPPREGTTVTANADAQYRNCYLAAVAVHQGERPGPGWQDETTRDDPRIRQLMEKVTVKVHPEAERLVSDRIKKNVFPLFWDVIVEIQAKGQTFSTEVNVIKGSAADPFTQEELNQKFRDNAAVSNLGPKKTEAVIQATSSLDEVGSVRELMDLVAKGTKSE
jgi:2-methylcitrate dehydratase PrpD